MKHTDQEIIDAIERLGVDAAATHLGIDRRSLQRRRRRIEQNQGVVISSRGQTIGHTSPPRIPLQIKNGHVLIGGDAHIWPGPMTTAMRAFIAFNKKFKPEHVILNGDVIDAATISRHPPIGWDRCPDVHEEIAVAVEQTDAIVAANPGATYSWPLGNHDARFETRLATVANEYRNVPGMCLKDHFPKWAPCWSVEINESLIVKHRWKGGTHAPHNNASASGRSMATGHMHRLQVTPYEDYNGHRFGMETGMLADKRGAQFTGYTEDGPLNWTSGFLLLTYKDGELMWPEIVRVWDDNHVEFRGELWEV